MRRRELIAALAGAAIAGRAAAHGELPPAARTLVEQGDAALARGDSLAAYDAYEQAAALAHTAEIEVGWVRSRMQAGEYRQAVGFAAHTAGVHPHDVEGAVICAWLLYLGGQEAPARQMLERALARHPQDPELLAVQARIVGQRADPPHALCSLPSLGDAVDASARVAGSALLLPGGQLALTASDVAGTGTVWLRNGLGHTTRATLVRNDAGLVVLRLGRAFDGPAGPAITSREPFPGSPGLAVAYGAQARAMPAWPRLTLGFIGGPPVGSTPRPAGLDLMPASAGAPVFDTAGRVIGLVLPPGEDGKHRLAPAAALRAFDGWVTDAPGAPQPVDLLYERSLRSTLQVLRA